MKLMESIRLTNCDKASLISC